LVNISLTKFLNRIHNHVYFNVSAISSCVFHLVSGKIDQPNNYLTKQRIPRGKSIVKDPSTVQH
jgi:hypothetical protein